jgi:hypothetical protein
MKYYPPLGRSRALDRACAAEIGADGERGPLRFPRTRTQSRGARPGAGVVRSDGALHVARGSRHPCRRRTAAPGCRDEGRLGAAAEASAASISIRQQRAGKGTARSTPAGDFVRFHAVCCWPVVPDAVIPSRAPPSSSFLPCFVLNLRLSTRRSNMTSWKHTVAIQHSAAALHAPCLRAAAMASTGHCFLECPLILSINGRHHRVTCLAFCHQFGTKPAANCQPSTYTLAGSMTQIKILQLLQGRCASFCHNRIPGI